ncbi:MAG TPA: isopeptide-forming domain-containing fimbrial protein [Collinsella aerofaciens]|nr:isopeptide-forming domain-containing fimbrial protein [Collinsella aerofaciens]
MSKNIARLAVTAGLTAALSFGGVMAPVTMAFAAGADGSVTIKNVDGNATEFKGYQIFNADVDNNGKVSNITWASTEVQGAVEDVIGKEDKSYVGTTAQDAADWIANNVKETGKTTRVDSNSVAYKIADAVDGLTESANTNNKTVSGLKHGYWLFVTKADTIGVGEAGTSPIFTVVGSKPVDITEKTGIPTVEKKIVSDKDSREYDAADSQIGQNVTYNLYGTIAENFDKYDTYFYRFSDQISKGLTLQTGAKVYLYKNRTDAKGDLARAKGTDITVYFNEETPAEAAEDGSKTTTWTCDNLKKVDGVTKDSYIVVSYTAQINESAVVGLDNNNEGNPNTVTLYYSNNPMTTDYGQTVPDTVRDYTYGLKINKVDLGTERALNGAKFTIMVKSADNKDAEGKYVQPDGKLDKDPYQFETTSDGTFTVKGLDTGTYTVEEVEAPQGGYTTVNSFDFTITPELGTDPDAKLTDVEYALQANGQQDQIIIGTPDDVKDDNKLEAAGGTSLNADGTFNITVGDTKQVGLPLTGLNGVTFTWIAGGAVLCIGVAHLIRSRKQAEESEQE